MTFDPAPALTEPRRVVDNQPTSGLAIAAVVLAFVLPLVGIVLGFIARSRVSRTGESGAGLAATAITVGFVFVAVAAVIIGVAAYRLVTTGRLVM